jgi:hypothetical protein
MTVMNERKVKIDNHFIDRCWKLNNEAIARHRAGGEFTIEEANGLRRAADDLHDAINDAIADVELEAKMARPEIGQQFSAWRFSYEDYPSGTVAAYEGDKVTIEVPERIIPARTERIIPASTEQIVPGFTFEAEWDDEHECWVDWSEEGDEEESDESDEE